MKKVIQLTEDFVVNDDYQRELKGINKTTQKIYELSLSNSNCIEEINTKLGMLQENSE